MEWAVHILLFVAGLALGVAASSILWGRHLERIHSDYRDLLLSNLANRATIARRLADFDTQPWGLDKVAQTRKDPPPPESP
jgi:hypothetical protein